MNDSKKKIIEYAIGFALSIAGGYFVIYVQLNDLFSWPSYVYNALSVFLGVLLIIFLMFFMRFLLVNYRNSKQELFMLMPPQSMPNGDYWAISEVYKGIMIKIKISRWTKEIHDVDGVFCPKKECQTELNTRRTFFGKYKFECPACSFKLTSEYNSHTLKSNFLKVTEAKRVRESENRIREQEEKIKAESESVSSEWI